MVEIKDIEKLALLARIKIEDSEKKELTKEIDSILKEIAAKNKAKLRDSKVSA